MINKALSAYTPSNMDADTLESMFVQRHQLLAQSVGWVEESLLTDKKNHLLFIGPRGCGKTHLITMIINRLKVSERLDDLIVIWLGEDDVVMNLTGLALSIINKMASAYPQRFNNDCLAQAKGRSTDEVADIILDDIKKQAGNTTLLLVKENMNDVFSGLKDLGQKRLRAYLQENRHLSILGTSQKLFNGVSSRDAAFWGFFDVQHLSTLGVDDALLLISNIAKINQDNELVDFLQTTQGNYRIRALHYLAGGNHRLYVELTSFLTKASLDDFVDAIMQLADHLTPYFQERIRSLSPQQATIIQKLCELNGAIQVKVIAESLFIDERAVASQLKDLKDMGYVIAHKRGRAAYYEIAEPLLRLSLEIKNNHGKPLKIVASLFRAWFSDTELEANMSDGNALLQAYCKTALADNEILGNLEQSIVKDLSEQIDKNNYKKVIDYTSELLCLTDIEPQNSITKRAVTLFNRSIAYSRQGKVEHELSDLNQLLEIKDVPSEITATALLNRSVTYSQQGNVEQELSDLNQLIRMEDASSELITKALLNRSVAYSRQGKIEQKLSDLNQILEIENAPSEIIARALLNRSVTYSQQSNVEQELSDLNQILEIENAPSEIIARALLNRSVTYSQQSNVEQELSDLNQILVMQDAPSELVATALFNRSITHSQQGNIKQKLSDLNQLIAMEDAPIELVATALFNRSVTYSRQGKVDQELSNLNQLLEVEDAPSELVATALFNRSIAHSQQGNIKQKLSDLNQLLAMEDAPSEIIANALFNRSITYSQQGNVDEELSDLNQLIAIENAPSKIIAYALFNRSVTYSQQGNVEQKLSDLNQLIAMKNAPSESVAKALFNRSITYSQQNDFNACIVDLQQLNALKEVSSELNNIGLFCLPEVYYRLSDISNAQRYLKTAFEQGDHQAENYPCNTDDMLDAITKLGMSHWQSEIEFLLSLYAEYDELPHLATGLIQVIQCFINDEMLSPSFGQWANLWQVASDAYPSMQPAVAAVNASVEALTVGNDKPLFSLPKEIRELIVPMFEQSPNLIW